MVTQAKKGGASGTAAPVTHETPRVGAPDPELKTSPILDEDEEELSFDAELEAPVCYFNGTTYPLGQYVLSGDEILRCDRGVWVRRGERKP